MKRKLPLSRSPIALVKVFHENSKQYGIAPRQREPVPKHLSLIFGDAAHNLRTALDMLANDLVALSGTKPKKVYFPFADSGEGIEKQLQGKMKGVAPDFADMIRELKPYRGGNELLRSLHDFDVLDKHIAIIAASASGATGALPMLQVGYERIAGDKPNRLTLKADLGALPSVPVDETKFLGRMPSNLKVVGEIVGGSYSTAIGKGSFNGRSPVELANQMANLVQGIVQSFETYSLRRDKPAP